MGPLTPAPRGVHDGSFRRTAVNDEGAAATGGSICKGKADQVDILAEVVAITESVGTRGCCALSEDDDETGKGNGENQCNITPCHVGQAEAGQAAGNGANKADALMVPMEISTGHSHSDHGEQSFHDWR